ncbi:unnamed protein product [Trichobilharzia regenti]|nr:unnamed protein product [Trichobilharzia regenti]
MTSDFHNPLLFFKYIFSIAYEKALRAAREYVKVEGVSLSTKPPDHCFFRRLPGLIERTRNKCDRENGLM